MRRLFSYNPSGGGGGGGGTITDGSVTTAKLGGDVTTAGKALLSSANAAAQRTTLGLGAGALAEVRFGTASVTVTPAVYGVATATVSDASATSGRTCWAALVPTTDFDADDLDDVFVVAQCGSGAITFTLSSAGPLVGTYGLTYAVAGA